MVGAIGFEPTTPCAQGRCATRLRYAPTLRSSIDSKLLPRTRPQLGICARPARPSRTRRRRPGWRRKPTLRRLDAPCETLDENELYSPRLRALSPFLGAFGFLLPATSKADPKNPSRSCLRESFQIRKESANMLQSS